MSAIGSTIRSASTVSMGTAIGQLIAFGGSLILVRVFSPEQMGVFATIVAVASFLSPIASGRLSVAIPLPRGDWSALKLARMAVIGAISVGALIAAALFLFGVFGKGEYSLNQIWWWSLPAVVVSLATYLASNQLAVRTQNYKGLAIRGVLYPTIMTLTQVGLGILNFGASGLILGMVFGHVATALTLWIPIQKTLTAEQDNSPRWTHLLKEYRSFPLALGPAGAINSLAMQLPQIGITFLFGVAIGGQFGLMMKILSVPVSLIGQSIGFVYAGHIAKARRNGETSVRGLFDRLSLTLAGVSVILVLGVTFLGEPVFAWLLGETWRPAGEYAALFAVATGAQLVSSPLSQTLVVSGRTGAQLLIDSIRAVILLGALGILYAFQLDDRFAIFTISIVSAIGYLALWLINRWAANDVKPNGIIAVVSAE